MRSFFVLILLAGAAAGLHSQDAPRQSGASAAWERMQKLRTTVSVMHITAHPDDEQGGVLAKLSRGDGARVTLLTLTRGESGDNAIGPELFDALGLIRTEELLAANRYYGVDQQYFTTAVDFGFSKRLDESMAKWGRESLLADVVRIIRIERPSMILSRFQGSDRDGHGNHQAAGMMALDAFSAAGDPSQFPEQLREGLTAWSPQKIYVGGVRPNEDWTVSINTGDYSAILGDSFENVARKGLSLQRSQNSGRFTPVSGPNQVYFKLAAFGAGVMGNAGDGGKEGSLLDSLPRNLEGAIGSAGRPIDEAVARALSAFRVDDPSASVPALAQGLKLTREAVATAIDPQYRHLLRIKEQQFQDAINAAMGAQLTAITNPAVMGAPVPGQSFGFDASFRIRGRTAADLSSIIFESPERGVSVTIVSHGVNSVNVPATAEIGTKENFYRLGLNDSRYTLRDPSKFSRPAGEPLVTAIATYRVDGVPVAIREPIKRRESKAPYGEVLREVRTVPRIAINVTPANAIFPVSAGAKAPALRTIEIEVTLLHNATGPSSGQVVLHLPEGWRAKPASQAFAFTRAGERTSYRFSVIPGAIEQQTYEIAATAIDGLGEYREGYELIDHRDLEVRYLYRDATTTVRGVDVTTVAGLKVGYVMGIGDQVPQGLQQLGAQVTLLGERELASANLSTYDTIITGTRAYAVRDDLETYNARLLDYVRNGGNMIVLYNTQELVPHTFAPFPGELPRTAEEVSEEDSPVTILAPTHQAFNWPNKITAADFDGWVEQRGSKFFTKWDASYTPMIATNDQGQAPQSGGWLTARFGKGTWTYFAYALHRQLPYGVAGAYRITANLLALNQQPR
jgi:LmbE family N-acetylglucosaminyl deacetylase